MIKKTFISMLLLIVMLGLFEINLTTLTDKAYEMIFPPQENSVQLSGDGIIKMNNKSLNMGDDLNTVIETFGDSMDMLVSEYGFIWYIYHNNYKDYMQIGIDNDKVVGFYSNSAQFSIEGIAVGTSVDDVRTTFGTPLEYILKGKVKHKQNSMIDGKHEMDVFGYQDMYITFFYDVFQQNTVTSINVIEKATEQGLRSVYASATQDLKYSFEMQNYYAVNALRVREGLSVMSFSTPIAAVAELHSKDMAQNNYFDHTNLKGQTVADRAKKGNVLFSMVAENIASGTQNSIVAHELLMNSEGHRVNILGDYKFLGVGVWFNSDSRPYLTQNFYNPPKVRIG